MKERFWRATAAVVTAGSLVGIGAPSAEASISTKKTSGCKITNPHFVEISRHSIPGSSATHDVNEVRYKDCLGTVMVCLQSVLSATEPLECFKNDYLRRARKNFAKARAQEPLR